MLVTSRCIIMMILLIFLGGCCGPDLITHDEMRGQEIRPYVGLIRNLADVAISIPSENSDAIVVVPAQQSAEFTVWQPNFKIFGYVDGKEVYCQNISVKPKKYTYFCRNYDFMAEIYSENPPPSALPAPFSAEPQRKPRL